MPRDVAADLTKSTWLADLVDEALLGYDPAAALLRLPGELRGTDPDGPSLEARARTLLVRSLRRRLLQPSGAAASGAPAAGTGTGSGEAASPQEIAEDAFLGPVEGHIGLLLDIALVHGVRFEPARRRAEIATFFAALTGQFEGVRATDPGAAGGGGPAVVARAFVRAGMVLLSRGHPAVDPKDGLPLRVGLLCIQRRHLARLAIAYYAQGTLDLATARRLHEQASADSAFLIEALAALVSASGPLGSRRMRACLGQVTKLQLPGDLARRAREAVRSPRSAGELARAVPLRLRGFLLEQLLIAELAASRSSPARSEVLRVFAEEAQIAPEQVAALESDAAELYADQQRWLEPSPANLAASGPPLSEDWEYYTEHMMDRVATAVTENLEAIVTEVKETGELGTLLAKAAGGHALSAPERLKVKGQLLDLAKAVPALAIFAAPGGAILLPLLARLLPFNVLPSAWDRRGRKKPGEPAPRRPGKERVPG